MTQILSFQHPPDHGFMEPTFLKPFLRHVKDGKGRGIKSLCLPHHLVPRLLKDVVPDDSYVHDFVCQYFLASFRFDAAVNETLSQSAKMCQKRRKPGVCSRTWANLHNTHTVRVKPSDDHPFPSRQVGSMAIRKAY
jgi:hypothetical protein